VNSCPDDLYFDVAEGADWDIDPAGRYIHYTAADTRQGFEFQEFPYEAIPEGMPLCCDASANLGSKPVGAWHLAAHSRLPSSRCCCVPSVVSLCRVLIFIVNVPLRPQISRSTG